MTDQLREAIAALSPAGFKRLSDALGCEPFATVTQAVAALRGLPDGVCMAIVALCAEVERLRAQLAAIDALVRPPRRMDDHARQHAAPLVDLVQALVVSAEDAGERAADAQAIAVAMRAQLAAETARAEKAEDELTACHLAHEHWRSEAEAQKRHGDARAEKAERERDETARDAVQETADSWGER